jgi:hypothetical protein
MRAIWPFITVKREPDAHLKVQPQRGAQIYVVFDFKVIGLWRAPSADHDVAMLIFAHGHALVRQVGDGFEHGLHLGLDGVQPSSGGIQLGFQGADFGHGGVGLSVLALTLEHANLLADGVALGLHFLSAHLDGFALGFQRLERIDVQEGLRVLAGLQTGNHRIQVFAQQGDI